ncbi:MAG: TetR/AcrR family transcriptional regulator [Alphaproteobacteria bacterium]|jgi:TetR/AcrR family transcriptional regulator, transcriptional repressor for nem operon|nr:TetR/AcrR family transcriptional regulator [Alphaproteobacteria bacterium]MBT4083310.1 TetR/AcrR family transcriptional regulator [Alphaproteobacteria bacterium]MBT4543038.1 TetR/AcrR family transcriptional regulator [Alphaproteobacteria bacterium]MBT7747566.1 TetR/AcrR family transcriptional regulator [Alphaproteobacteria bacterium]
MGKGSETQALLMDLAESAILEKGFGATSIEELISAAGITKSGFFYHFRDKTELARALLVRYIDREEVLLDDLFNRAHELHDDPLHAFLIGLKLFAEMMADLPEGHPGCLVAIYCYQERLFDAEIVRMNAEAATAWRIRFRNHLDLIAAKYPPRDNVDLDALADMVSTIVEGGIIMSKAMKDPNILAEQIILFRSYIKLLFSPAG